MYTAQSLWAALHRLPTPRLGLSLPLLALVGSGYFYQCYVDTFPSQRLHHPCRSIVLYSFSIRSPSNRSPSSRLNVEKKDQARVDVFHIEAAASHSDSHPPLLGSQQFSPCPFPSPASIYMQHRADSLGKAGGAADHEG
ncbi:hypothetical protein C8Q70DRAFT_598088 [Cubamyces menziesii]|nr:hypothetical protein C8Q70DRAFT_598088 [Cubamyces menziesii]